MQLNAETGLEVPVQHHGSLGVHNRGTGQTAADCLVYQLRIGTGLLGKGESLGHSRNVNGHYHLVGKLCHVAGAQLAYIHHRTGHNHQHIIVLVKQLLLATAHNGKGAVDGLGLAAGYGAVQHLNAVLGTLGANGLAFGGINGAHVDENQTRLCTFSHAVLAQNCASYVGRVGNHGDDNFHLGSNLFAAFGRRCAAGYQIRHCILIKIKDNQLMSGLYQVLCHRSSHNS